jgi:hypothetical protein
LWEYVAQEVRAMRGHQPRSSNNAPTRLHAEEVDGMLCVELVDLSTIGAGECRPTAFTQVGVVSNPMVLLDSVGVEVPVLRDGELDGVRGEQLN